MGMVQGAYAKRSLTDKFKLLRKLGFDGVELPSPNRYSTSEVLEAMAASKIEIPGVVNSAHWHARLNDPSPKVRSKGIAALETALRDAGAYGASTALLVPGVVDKAHDYEQCYRLSQECIRQVLPLARELQVQVAVENVWNNFLLSPLELARYLDEFESPWIGAYFDVGNVVRSGWPEQWIRTLRHRILKIDVKEYHRRRRTFQVPLLEGDCDWPAVMRALHEVGYRGWFTAEVQGGGVDALLEIRKRMDQILELAPRRVRRAERLQAP